MKLSKKYLPVALVVLAFFFISFTVINKVMQPYNSYKYIVETLAANYIHEISIEDLHNNALKGLLKSLDPYSKYYSKAENEKRTNKWAGILDYSVGVNVLYRDNYTYVRSVNASSPAEAADVRAGDKIVAINNETIYRAYNKDVEKKLKGKDNTTVELIIERPTETKSIKKVMSRSAIPNVAIPYSKLNTNGSAYIKLKHFYGNSADTLKQLITNWQNSKQPFNSLILDLRNNSGGGVRQAKEVASLFLPEQSVVYFQKKRNMDFESVKTEQAPIAPSLPLIVLIDENTMSAAELVAGALQDYDRAVIIGENSFGKGLIQQTWKNVDTTSMYFTTSKYYTPLKRCIQKLDYEDYYLKNEKERKKKQTYSQKEKQWFTTLNGRKFSDYSGIVPDIELTKNKENAYVTKIGNSFALYDFANSYRNNNTTSPNFENFEIDDDTFKEFLDFLHQPENNVKLPIYRELADIEDFINETASDENLTQEFLQFKETLNQAKQIVYKQKEAELKALLTETILYRYHNLKGQYAFRFKNDEWVKEAFKILSNEEQYKSILGF